MVTMSIMVISTDRACKIERVLIYCYFVFIDILEWKNYAHDNTGRMNLFMLAFVVSIDCPIQWCLRIMFKIKLTMIMCRLAQEEERWLK